MNYTIFLLFIISIGIIFNLFRYIKNRNLKPTHAVRKLNVMFLAIVSFSLISHSLSFFYIANHAEPGEITANLILTCITFIGGICGIVNAQLAFRDR